MVAGCPSRGQWPGHRCLLIFSLPRDSGGAAAPACGRQAGRACGRCGGRAGDAAGVPSGWVVGGRSEGVSPADLEEQRGDLERGLSGSRHVGAEPQGWCPSLFPTGWPLSRPPGRPATAWVSNPLPPSAALLTRGCFSSAPRPPEPLLRRVCRASSSARRPPWAPTWASRTPTGDLLDPGLGREALWASLGSEEMLWPRPGPVETGGPGALPSVQIQTPGPSSGCSPGPPRVPVPVANPKKRILA